MSRTAPVAGARKGSGVDVKVEGGETETNVRLSVRVTMQGVTINNYQTAVSSCHLLDWQIVNILTSQL